MTELEAAIQAANLTPATLTALLRDLMRNPWLTGTEVTVTVPAGQVFAQVNHGLGRGMNGAAVVATSDPAIFGTVSFPADVSPPTQVRVTLPSIMPNDVTFKLRVY